MELSASLSPLLYTPLLPSYPSPCRIDVLPTISDPQDNKAMAGPLSRSPSLPLIFHHKFNKENTAVLKPHLPGTSETPSHSIIGSQPEVYGNAEVYGDAEVYGTAKIYGDAVICGSYEIRGHTVSEGKRGC